MNTRRKDILDSSNSNPRKLVSQLNINPLNTGNASNIVEQEKYPFRRLINDLKADLVSYAKNLLGLEQITFWDGLKIVFRYPTFWLLVFHRYRFWVHWRFKNKYIRKVMKVFSLLGQRTFELITKSEILGTTEIGPGFCFAGKGGVNLGAKKIGRGCIIFENVTIGRDHLRNIPELGEFVRIGANTVIYGGIKIGNGVIIKESTVLSKSVPDYCFVQGNPGRIVKRLGNSKK